MSPFQANSGQNPRMGFEMRKKGRFEKAEKFVERMKEVQGEAKAALAKALKGANGGLAATSKMRKVAVAVPNRVLKVQGGE